MIQDDREQGSIELCPRSEIGRLKQFIHEHWSAGHILSVNDRLMDWQYYSREKDCYHFMLARDPANGEILGMLGYIPTALHDPSLAARNTVWFTMWTTRPGAASAGLGLALRSAVLEREKPLLYGSVGIHPRTILLYKPFGYFVGRLEQYYLVNRTLSDFQLLDRFDGRYDSDSGGQDDAKAFTELTEENFGQLQETFHYRQPDDIVPTKSLEYFANRYVRHPFYHYDVYAVTRKGKTQAVAVFREAIHGGRSALRMVDYWGPAEGLAGMRDQLQNLVKKRGSEYVDLLNYGIAEDLIARWGLLKREESSGVVVPHYFEPFERRNIEVAFAYKADKGLRYLIFKGDCDQDRPSLLP